LLVPCKIQQLGSQLALTRELVNLFGEIVPEELFSQGDLMIFIVLQNPLPCLLVYPSKQHWAVWVQFKKRLDVACLHHIGDDCVSNVHDITSSTI
jgi:hypothetical protein